MDLGAPRHTGFPQTRDQTCVYCIGRRFLATEGSLTCRTLKTTNTGSICRYSSLYLTPNSGILRATRLRPLNFVGHFSFDFFGCNFSCVLLEHSSHLSVLKLVCVSSYLCPLKTMGLYQDQAIVSGSLKSSQSFNTIRKTFSDNKGDKFPLTQLMRTSLTFIIVLCLAH